MKKILSLGMIIAFVFILAACGGESEAPEVESKQQEEEVFVVFRHLDLQTEDTVFELTGEVRAEGDKFYYKVDQGEDNLIEEQSVEISLDQEWISFEIREELPDEAKEKEEAPIITMYGKTEDGERVNANFIPVDIGIK